MPHMRYVSLALFCALACTALPLQAGAAQLSFVRDTISTSRPSTDASHVVEFTLGTAVPAGGHIVIVPEDGDFTIPSGFSYTDADLAVSTGSGFVDRSLAATASATDDGVAVTTGTHGDVTFTLNASTGIPSGAQVRATLGRAATVGTTSTYSIQNPATIGSYHIYITTDDGSSLDTGTTMIAIVASVGLSAQPISLEPIRFNGLPSGTLGLGANANIELSLQTVDPSTCRFSTTASTTYAAMTKVFTSWDSGRTFSYNETGYGYDTTYTYYVRCKDVNSGKENSSDYIITFTTGAEPDYSTSIEGNGIVGRGGSGPYPNGSASLFLANVTLRGWTSPNSIVKVLKDGSPVATVGSKADGSFTSQVQNLERGVYTFVMSARDAEGYQSGGVSATLTVEQGTSNTITDLVLPPSLGFEPISPGLGDDVRVLGASVPNSRVEVVFTLKSKDPVAPQGYAATTTSAGTWELTVPAKDLTKGTYIVKARVIVSDSSKSDWGTTALLGVGEIADDTWSRSDLNHDGKVNLVDFSILLTTWGDSGIGDINKDDTTNLSDFSIMLFDWTG